MEKRSKIIITQEDLEQILSTINPDLYSNIIIKPEVLESLRSFPEFVNIHTTDEDHPDLIGKYKGIPVYLNGDKIEVKQVIKNFDRITEKIGALAHFLCGVCSCDDGFCPETLCKEKYGNNPFSCKKVWQEWLKQEYKEEA